MGSNLLFKVMENVAVIDCLSLILELEHWFLLLFQSSLTILAHISTEFDQNLWLKKVRFGIFQHNLRIDIRIDIRLLTSELQLEYAFYFWFSYDEQNLEVGKGFESRVFRFQCCLSLIIYWCISVAIATKVFTTPPL